MLYKVFLETRVVDMETLGKLPFSIHIHHPGSGFSLCEVLTRLFSEAGVVAIPGPVIPEQPPGHPPKHPQETPPRNSWLRAWAREPLVSGRCLLGVPPETLGYPLVRRSHTPPVPPDTLGYSSSLGPRATCTSQKLLVTP